MANPYPRSTEHAAKISAALKRRYSDPIERARMSDLLKALWADPEYRKKHSKPKTAEHRAKMAMNKQVQCPHCGTLGSKVIMARWHFNNCKNA